MIARLSGTVAEIGEDFAVIDCAGVGYHAQCSGRTLERLPPVGGLATLHVETLMREDSIRLLGFAERAERDWFRILTTVQGVGPRIALAILSSLSAEELLAAIASGDKAMVSRADGVGPKLAQRIVSELKDKAGSMFFGAQTGVGGPGAAQPAAQAVAGVQGAASDAVSALVNLGYRQAEAFTAVAKVAQEQGAKVTVDALIRAGLKELAR
ncbi:MAG: Holliday junction branch migration protein RuvA [Rhodospirillales bacterium]|nr:Holliday junction branch migration protein RuvA [Rhodospirillales bacterium]